MSKLKDVVNWFNPLTESHKDNELYISKYISGTPGSGAIYEDRKLREQNIDVWNYSEVQILSADIILCGQKPVKLLPPCGGGKYYVYHGILEVSEGTTPFDFNDNLFIGTMNNNYTGTILSGSTHQVNNKQAIEFDSKTSVNGVILNNASSDVITYGLGSGIGYNFDNQGVFLTTWFGTNATVGDMTFLAKFWYKIENFGSNL